MSASSFPLTGRRIVVTRAEAQAGDLIQRLRALGAEVIACPAISIRPPEDFGPLDEALRELAGFDWVVFTSANAVRSVVDRLTLAPGGPGALRLVRIAAVGAATGRALLAFGVSANRIPDRFTSTALVEAMGDVRELRILLPRADIALPALPDALRAAGARVHEVTAYRTVPADDIARLGKRLTQQGMDVIAFTSPSTARYFLEGLRSEGALDRLLADERRPAMICIGPTTADAVRQFARGLSVDAIADVHDMEGLVDAIVEWCAKAVGGEQGSYPVAKEHDVNTLELDDQLNTMIGQGKSQDAFLAFYAEDVVAQENDEPERIGRDAWMRGRQEMEKSIRKFHARVLAHAAHGDTSFSEWEYDVELEGVGAIKIAQVAVRRWKDGKVVRERFYHK